MVEPGLERGGQSLAHHRRSDRQQDKASHDGNRHTHGKKVERRRAAGEHAHDDLHEDQREADRQRDGDSRAEQRSAELDEVPNRVIAQHRVARRQRLVTLHHEAGEHQVAVHAEQEEGGEDRQERADRLRRLAG